MKKITLVKDKYAILDIFGSQDNGVSNFYAKDESSYLWFIGSGNKYNGGPTQTSSVLNWEFLPWRQWGSKLSFTVTGSAGFGIDNSNILWGWGLDFAEGILGQNKAIATMSPVSIMKAIEVSAGNSHVIALNESSYAWCWGINTSGQLGNNSTAYASSPVSVLGGRQFRKVYATGTSSFALDSSSYAWYWGYDSLNPLTSSPVSVVGGIRWRNLGVSTYAILGIDESSKLWSWGSRKGLTGSTVPEEVSISNLRWLDIGSCESQQQCTVIDQYSRLWLFQFLKKGAENIDPPQLYEGYKKIKSGNNIGSLLLDNNNNLYFYRPTYVGNGTPLVTSNYYCSLPIATKIAKKTFIQGDFGNRTMQGLGKNFFIDSSSNVWGWGRGDDLLQAVCLDSATQTIRAPQILTTKKNIVRIMPSSYNNIAIDSSSFLWVWGANNNGNLAQNNTNNISSMVSVIGNRQFKNVRSRNQTFIAQDASDVLWGWGINSTGELGVGDALSRSSPVSVGYAKPFIDFDFIVNTSCALDQSSYLWTWGGSTYIGDGFVLNRSSPVSVLGGRKFRIHRIDDYLGFLPVFLDESSFMWIWGNNTSGILGDNSAANRSSPVSVVGGRKFIKVLYEGSRPCCIGLDESSYLWGWGSNGSGNLGDNSVANRSSPVSVVGGRQYRDFISYGSRSYAIDSSSYVWAWGAAGLGDGTLLSRSSPVSVASSNQWDKLCIVNDRVCGFTSSSSYLWYFSQFPPEAYMSAPTGVVSSIPQIFLSTDILKAPVDVSFNNIFGKR
jgi:alpha-tubulin suppressor-like RCC1 family protein